MRIYHLLVYYLRRYWTGCYIWLHLVVLFILSYEKKVSHCKRYVSSVPLNLTWEQLAMVLVGRPIEGAQPTSLTQSLWASSFWSSFHWPSSSLQAESDNQRQIKQSAHWDVILQKKKKKPSESEFSVFPRVLRNIFHILTCIIHVNVLPKLPSGF